jgi:hypothetical protein
MRYRHLAKLADVDNLAPIFHVMLLKKKNI